MIETLLSRRDALKLGGLASGTIMAAGLPHPTYAKPGLQETPSDQMPIDDYISTETLRIGDLAFYNGAIMKMSAPQLQISKDIRLNTHIKWDSDTITPPPFEASILRTNTGTGITFLHSSYLLRNDGTPIELPGEPFRALVEGTRRAGFLGDLQFNYHKVKLLEQYPIFSLSIDGHSQQFYVQRINFYNTREMSGALKADLFTSGDKDTLKIYTCGLSAHTAVNECAEMMSQKNFEDNPMAQKALQALTNPASTAGELKEAVLRTCPNFYPDSAGTIVATYMGAKEIIIEEKVDGIIQRKIAYHNILKEDLEKMGIYYYTDRRIVWTLQKI